MGDVCVKREKNCVWKSSRSKCYLQHAVHFALVHCICVLSEEVFRDVHCMKQLTILYDEFLLHNSYCVSKKNLNKSKITSPATGSKHGSHFRILAGTCEAFKYLLVDKEVNLLVR